MDPIDEQVVRIGHVGRRVRFGIAVAAVLVLAATAKPWALVPSQPDPTLPAEFAAVATPIPTSTPTPAPTPQPTYTDWDSNVCVSPDGWRVVADDVELGRSVRSWVVATPAYSFVPPLITAIPKTLLISHGVSLLGFCVPADLAPPTGAGWTATLWRQGVDAANPNGWLAVASVNPPPGSLGAPAHPFDRSAVGWPPGKYVLEARFQNSLTEAWLGVVIQAE